MSSNHWSFLDRALWVMRIHYFGTAYEIGPGQFMIPELLVSWAHKDYIFLKLSFQLRDIIKHGKSNIKYKKSPILKQFISI